MIDRLSIIKAGRKTNAEIIPVVHAEGFLVFRNITNWEINANKSIVIAKDAKTTIAFSRKLESDQVFTQIKIGTCVKTRLKAIAIGAGLLSDQIKSRKI